MSTKQIDNLLLHWQERRRQGDTTPAEELCRDCPELLPELAKRIAALESYHGVDPVESTVRVSGTQPERRVLGDWPRVDGYVIEGELGRGGMGVVYRAIQIGAARTVALKMISGLARPSLPEIERFYREARLLASLQHPNIVQVFEVSEHDGLPFFSMEYVAGGPLGRKLGGQPLPPDDAARLVATVARAVHVAHEKGILHRDLKPSNILLARDPSTGGRFSPLGPAEKGGERYLPSLAPLEREGEGQGPYLTPPTLPVARERGEAADPSPPLAGFIPKVADFGLAKNVEQDDGQTPSGVAIGTPSYMAPEQARAGKELTRATDVYGLGAILYELLTGRPPFRAETTRETMLAVLLEEPKPPRTVQPDVPRDLEAVCLKCLQKEPAKRYATAEELAEELERWGRGEPTFARPPGWPRRAARFIRKNAAVGVVALLLLAVLAGLAAAWFFSPRRRLASAQQRLAAGETVTLIDENGPPGWSALPVYGRDGVEISEKKDRPFRVSTFSVGAIELLPDVPLPRYRVRALIKHEEGALVSAVGLYIGRRAYKTPMGTEHYLYELVFQDQPLGGDRLPLQLRLRRLSDPQPETNRHARLSLGFPNNVLPPALEGDKAPWRAIVVDVTPEAIRAWENGQFLGEVKLNEFRKQTQLWLARHGHEGVDDPTPPTEGGFGLLVEGGAGLFRSVRVGPIVGDP